MKYPKGTLLLIGGAEDKEHGRDLVMELENKQFNKYEILETFVEKVGKRSTVEVITTATNEPKELAVSYKQTLKKLGIKNIKVINIQNREEAYLDDYVERITSAEGVFFTGGNQFKLTTILGGTKFIETLNNRYYEDAGFVIAGTSAGASAMSTVMIYEGNTTEALLKGDIKTMSGLGFISNCIVDTHFVKRGRFGRLAHAVIMNPTCVGIGLGEDTALIIEKGNVMRTIGSGMVTVIDGCSIKYTNIITTEESTPVCVENLIVHILAKGNGYLLRSREFFPGEHASNNTKQGKLI